jgi:hypothetical protein
MSNPDMGHWEWGGGAGSGGLRRSPFRLCRFQPDAEATVIFVDELNAVGF